MRRGYLSQKSKIDSTTFQKNMENFRSRQQKRASYSPKRASAALESQRSSHNRILNIDTRVMYNTFENFHRPNTGGVSDPNNKYRPTSNHKKQAKTESNFFQKYWSKRNEKSSYNKNPNNREKHRMKIDPKQRLFFKREEKKRKSRKASKKQLKRYSSQQQRAMVTTSHDQKNPLFNNFVRSRNERDSYKSRARRWDIGSNQFFATEDNSKQGVVKERRSEPDTGSGKRLRCSGQKTKHLLERLNSQIKCIADTVSSLKVTKRLSLKLKLRDRMYFIFSFLSESKNSNDLGAHLITLFVVFY